MIHPVRSFLLDQILHLRSERTANRHTPPLKTTDTVHKDDCTCKQTAESARHRRSSVDGNKNTLKHEIDEESLVKLRTYAKKTEAPNNTCILSASIDRQTAGMGD
jgi:hypothetical protein